MFCTPNDKALMQHTLYSCGELNLNICGYEDMECFLMSIVHGDNFYLSLYSMLSFFRQGHAFACTLPLEAQSLHRCCRFSQEVTYHYLTKAYVRLQQFGEEELDVIIDNVDSDLIELLSSDGHLGVAFSSSHGLGIRPFSKSVSSPCLSLLQKEKVDHPLIFWASLLQQHFIDFKGFVFEARQFLRCVALRCLMTLRLKKLMCKAEMVKFERGYLGQLEGGDKNLISFEVWSILNTLTLRKASLSIENKLLKDIEYLHNSQDETVKFIQQSVSIRSKVDGVWTQWCAALLKSQRREQLLNLNES
jgi:hypothetical protein